ncbi:MAG TPA: hypothetical protein DDX39_08295 [Bacteroidales bacterium]|nr:MAG: hypothetical protein A2W98_09765 [Bacteroidetes bacterium GWF2_33_38]OFY73089.1 MAG: hypothetical protein A2265_00415 [Bacteroidetes bacterium RIFOXYA12_FULL_33_9]HBF88626.1 hypothetical protein [Bacteroidales bacterium]
MLLPTKNPGCLLVTTPIEAGKKNLNISVIKELNSPNYFPKIFLKLQNIFYIYNSQKKEETTKKQKELN